MCFTEKNKQKTKNYCLDDPLIPPFPTGKQNVCL